MCRATLEEGSMREPTRREVLKAGVATAASLGLGPVFAAAGAGEGGAAGVGAAAQDEQRSDLTLWYRQPASRWVEALPVGNGRLGAMVFGQTGRERLQLNEETVWSGGPWDASNPEALKHLPEVRRLLFEGKPAEADDLAGRTMMGDPLRMPPYQTLGNLWL